MSDRGDGAAWSRRELLGAVAGAVGVAAAGCETRPLRSDRSATGTDGPTTGTADPPTVRIPGGTYTIGTDDGPADARPAHTVALDPFRIDRHEVTNAGLAAFLNERFAPRPGASAAAGTVGREHLRPEEADRLIEGPEGEERRPLVALDDEHARIGIAEGSFVVEPGYGDHPATEVTWDGARAYCRWRGGRLPTEAEWEAAARGHEGRTYPWGEAAPTPERAVYGRASGETAPVGSHPAGATPDGVHDMAGNVSEWTSSLYRPYPYDADDGREDPTVRGERVTRGGAHVFFEAAELAAYHRTGFSREFDRGHRHIGLRCVCSADGTPD